MTMCGMSAAFAALFGTPLTAAIFAMEVVSVGVMYYSAIVPCILSAVIGFAVAEFFWVEPERYHLAGIAQSVFAYRRGRRFDSGAYLFGGKL